jgi:hypothetical protein
VPMERPGGGEVGPLRRQGDGSTVDSATTIRISPPSGNRTLAKEEWLKWRLRRGDRTNSTRSAFSRVRKPGEKTLRLAAAW